MEYLSEEKRNELKAELEYLRTVKRKEVAESLEFAKSLGDLSENAEYIQAREDQAGAEERIAKIENILKSAVIVGKHKAGIADVGSTVVVRKQGGEPQKFHIVGSEESNMAEGKISNSSPLGVALSGKKKGDTVVFESPKGKAVYEILEVE
ncbi:MAG: transcription elongation factor GreA [Patescibacteria group bacterium]